MARKQLPRTKPPAVHQGKPALSSFVVPFGRDGGERFPPSFLHHLPSSRVSRSMEERKGRRGPGVPAGGTERFFEGRSLKRLSASEARTRPRRKNARNAAAEGSGAAWPRTTLPHASCPQPPRKRSYEPRPDTARRCGRCTVPAVTWTAHSPFSISDFQIQQDLSSPNSFTRVVLNQARAAI